MTYYVDNSGSTAGSKLYWDNVKKIVGDYESDKVVFWNDKVETPAAKKGFLAADPPKSTGGTNLLPVIKALAKKNPKQVTIITDGEISDIAQCQTALESLGDIDVKLVVVDLGDFEQYSLSIPLVFSVVPKFSFSKISKSGEEEIIDSSRNDYDWANEFVNNFSDQTLNKFNIFLNSKKSIWTTEEFENFRSGLLNKVKKHFASDTAETFDNFKCTPEDLARFCQSAYCEPWQKITAAIQSSLAKILANEYISAIARIESISIPPRPVVFEVPEEDEVVDEGALDSITLEFIPEKSDAYLYFYDPGFDTRQDFARRQHYLALFNSFLVKKTICSFLLLPTNYQGCSIVNCTGLGPNNKPSLALVIRSDEVYEKQTEDERKRDTYYNDQILAKLTRKKYDPTELLVSLFLWFHQNDKKHEGDLLRKELKRRFTKLVYVPERNRSVPCNFFLYVKYGQHCIADTKPSFTRKCFDQLCLLFEVLKNPDSKFDIVITGLEKKIIECVDKKLHHTKLMHFYLARKYWPIKIGVDGYNNPSFGYLMCDPNDKETTKNLRMISADPRYSKVDKDENSNSVIEPFFSFQQQWQTNFIKFFIKIGKEEPTLVEFNMNLVDKEFDKHKIDLPKWYEEKWDDALGQYNTRGHEHYRSNQNRTDADLVEMYRKFGDQPFIPMYALFNWVLHARDEDETSNTSNQQKLKRKFDTWPRQKQFEYYFAAICKYNGSKLYYDDGKYRHKSANMR